ncbi:MULTISPECIES: Ig-like domain-containing protein [unclassified Leptolyngbya]|uniref:Ig-like domain-containing protein n=1 Tax=unclassified Leptolyngbya TaxID=2650499 RepID=UPI001681FE87|nr:MULTISPECIES: Ig-like domain-containing protein [unclassified Leptolyngbya]MBD1910223.1 hypothetical protein [Leptolyngbya sp. FACHB-8]MBD2156401.1 hypothetical protein [Leptolyngbya sp. FACHB-16]
MKTLLASVAALGVVLSPVVLPQFALAQRLVDVEPAVNGQNVPSNTSISGEFDAGNGPAVDPGSVRILVNGQDVTGQSTITRGFFTYRPAQPLPAGQLVRVQVDYRNVNGDRQTTSWSFTTQAAQPTAQITSVTHSANAGSQASGSTFRVTINGTPGAQASVLLVQDGRTIRELRAQETSSGVYTATLPVGQSDRVQEGVVVARLQRQGQSTYAAAPQPFQFGVATQPTPTPTPSPSPSPQPTPSPTQGELRPRFTSHRDGQEVGNGRFTLVGQTRPNATVDIQVTYRVSVLGVNVVEQTLVDEEVQADRNGQFQLEVSPPRLPVPGVRYTVRATARQGNETSSETRITLSQR